MSFRKLHIVANTSSSTEAFARRTNELSRFISGLARQESELVRGLKGGQSISLIRVDNEESGFSEDGPIRRHILSLHQLTSHANPNDIYRASSDLKELQNHFEPIIESMRKTIVSESADVVLLGGTYYVPWCLLKAARSASKPVVLCYAGILSREIAHLPEQMRSVLKIMEQDFYDPSIFYIFPSELTRIEVERIFNKHLTNYEVVFNGVPEEFLGFREDSAKKEVHIAFVGRFTSVKNPEFLLELATTLKAMGKEMNIHMVTRTDEYNPKAQQLRSIGVIVLPPMNTSSLGGFYRRSHLLISPSHFETYGNAPLEAVSSGTPALVSERMGVSEVFRLLGLTDLIIDFSDVRNVIRKIDEMLGNGFRIKSDIITKIRENLSWSKVIIRYLGICAKQAEKATPSSPEQPPSRLLQP